MPSSAAGTPGRSSRHAASRHAAPPRRGRRVLIGIFVALALVITTGAAAGAVLWRRLEGNIQAQSVDRLLGIRPAAPTRAPDEPVDLSQVNILVMGSDTRKGNPAEGHDVYGSPRSDTTILLHLAEGRKSAVGVSIPRDSVVDIPSCKRPDGSEVPPRPHTIFNEAFGDGPACTYRTVEQLTGIRIDHYVVVDFNGFKGMVSALGGVTVCLPQAVSDPLSHLDLSAGKHTVKGPDALAYVRARHGIGNGSDLGRIDRQQAFLSSMIQKVTSAGTLTNPVRLVRFLDAATKSLKTDPGLANLNTMRKLAQSVNGMASRDITFLTIPNEEYPPDPYRVQWKQPQADAVWSAIRNDTPVPGTRAAKEAAKASPSPSSTEPPLTTRPPAVRVRVVNASGVSGTGTRAADALRAEGFQVVAVTSAAQSATTTVRHSNAYDQSGRTLAAAVPGAVLAVDDTLGRTVSLELGADFGGTAAISTDRFRGGTPKPSGTPVVKSRTADQNICT